MAEFMLPERVVTVELADSQFKGAEITVRTNLPLGMYLRIEGLLEQLTGGASAAGIEEAIRIFIDEGLRGWNLADHRGPIPPTVEGMRDRLEPLLVGAIIRTWLEEVGGVAAPLAEPSGAGTTSGARPARRRRPSSPRP